MNKLHGLWRRVVGTVRRRGGDEEIAAELESHLAIHVEENLRRGMTAAEARRQALIALGGVEQVKERYREQRGIAWIESLAQDVRFALRMLRKNPGFTAIAVVTLALGIGANTAIFTVVYGTLVQALPFPEPNRIVQLAETYEGHSQQMGMTNVQLLRLRDFASPFEALSGYTEVDFNMTAESGAAEHVRSMPVSADFVRVLDVQPEAGRNFSAEEDSGDGVPVALVSHALSVTRFGSVEGALGKTIFLSGTPYTVIGVMPPHFASDFTGLGGEGLWDIWIPISRVANTAGAGENIEVIARMKRGATWAQVTPETERAKTDFHKEFPGDSGDSDYMSFVPLARLMGLDVRPYLLVLLGATGFVLLIACANVSNLLLARGSARTREIAVRMAMGASRRRLLRQLLTESMIVAFAGGAIGLSVARQGIAALIAIAPAATARGPVGLPRVGDISVNWAIALFALGTSALCGALFGIVPALYAGKTNLNVELREGSSGTGTRRGHARLRQGLIAGEFALSLVLLTGAGLMIATCAKLLNTSPGFDPHHVLTMEFWLAGTKYDTMPKISAYYDQVESKVAVLPGVKAVGVVAAGLPLERGGNYPVRIAGPSQNRVYDPDYREVSAGYFSAMGIALLEGRGFQETDAVTSAPVVVVNDAFAKRFFVKQDAIGRRILIRRQPHEIIGVVADAKSSLDASASPTVFVVAPQASYATSVLFEGWGPRRLVLRTGGDPLAMQRALRDAVASVDSSVATGAMVSMDQMMFKSMALQRFMMVLLSLFGGLAIVLASVGIYGVISYGVSQRTREIGIRMALGARPGEVLRMILAQGLKVVIAGVIFGVAAAAMLTKLLQGLIYGVSARDPLVFALGIAALMGVAMVACYVPARRAMRVEPVEALRHE